MELKGYRLILIKPINIALTAILMIFFCGECNAQASGSYVKFAEMAVAVGDTEGSLALSFNIDKGLGKKGGIIVTGSGISH